MKIGQQKSGILLEIIKEYIVGGIGKCKSHTK